MKKDVIIHARCTAEQKQALERRADKSGMSLSEYIVKCASNSRTRISNTSKDMTRTITQFQICINNMSTDLGKIETEKKIEVGSMKKNINDIQEGLDELWRLLK